MSQIFKHKGHWLLITGLLFPSFVEGTEDDYQKLVELFRFENVEQAMALSEAYLLKNPEGVQSEKLRLMRLSVLFDQGQYRELIEKIRGSATLSEAEVYMLTGAHCFLGDYDYTIKLANEYAEKWRAGNYLIEISYFKAVSLSRLGNVALARPLLEKLVGEDTEDAVYSELARYELALMDFNTRQYEEAKKQLSDLLQSAKSENVRVQTQLLLARCYAVTRDRGQAEKNYLEVLSVAREAKLDVLEQEVLFYIVSFYGREKIAGDPNPDLGQCLPYYYAFFERYPDSEYAAQVAAAGMPALIADGKAKLGAEQLERVLRSFCEKGEEAGLRVAANALVWGWINAGEKMGDVHKRLSAESSSSFTNVMLHALAGVYQDGVRQAAGSWGTRLRFIALADSVYAEMLEAGGEMPAYVGNDLAWWVLESEKAPELAKEQLQIAQKSELQKQRNLAALGMSVVLRQLGEERHLLRAQKLLKKLAVRSEGDLQFLEKILHQQIEISNELEDWVSVTGLAREYLMTQKFTNNGSRVSYLLAKSYDKRGMNDDAIGNFTRIFTSYTLSLGVSAPSVRRLIELTWERNFPEKEGEPSDRQIAYQLGHRYLSLIEDAPEWKRTQDPVATELQSIRSHVTSWEQSGEVKTVKELLRERR